VCARRLAFASGNTLVEIVIILSLMGIAIGIAFPALNAKPQNLAADTQDLANNLQVARELGISRTVHYRIRVATSGPPYTYVMERNTGPSWVAERTITLRSNVQFPAGTLGLVAEFDTRGMLVTTPLPVFTLQDAARNWTKTVTVDGVGMVDHT